MAFHFEFTLSLFTPGEAEQITGLSTAMQRDWRRHGYLPSGNGHARFDALALGEMMFLKAMADRGIGPQQASPIAQIAGAGIALGALKHDAAFEGDEYPRDGMTRAFSVVRKNSRSDTVSGGAMPAPFLIIWADGTEHWDVGPSEAIQRLEQSGINAEEYAAKLNGPIIVLDQDVMGTTLLQRADRPLVHVERVDD